MRLLIKVLIFLTCVMVGTVWAGSKEDFQKALSNFNSLSSNAKRAGLRSEWLAVHNAFEKAYTSSPKSGEAPQCLFYMARSYEELSMRSKRKADRDHAVKTYQMLIGRYPKHELAAEAGTHVQQLQTPGKSTVTAQQEPRRDAPAKEEKGKSKLPAQAKVPKGVPILQSVRHWSGDEYTRVVVDLSKDVAFTKSLQDGKKQLQIDLPGTQIAKDVMPSRAVKDGILSHIRVVSVENDVARITLDLHKMDHYRTFTLPDPYRLVIDVFGTDEKGQNCAKSDADDAVGNALKELTNKKSAEQDDGKNTASEDTKKAGKELSASAGKSKKSKSGKKQAVSEAETSDKAANRDKDDKPDMVINGKQKKMAGSLCEQLGLTVRRIMIDAGHGGHDPGAMANGLKEKDINLKMAKALGKALQSQGFDVVYTRTTDKFIPLEERTALANAKNADLFISVHCNSYKDESIRGLEVYYLNLATDAQAVRVAARENGISVKKISDMQFILSDLMLNSKISESRDMANIVEQQAGQIVKDYGSKGHGAKGAFFYVLTGARMPSILVELGYLTSPNEAANFKSNEYITSLAKGIAQGVVAYKKKLERFATNPASRS